jgi:hypothetical protein
LRLISRRPAFQQLHDLRFLEELRPPERIAVMFRVAARCIAPELLRCADYVPDPNVVQRRALIRQGKRDLSYVHASEKVQEVGWVLVIGNGNRGDVREGF